MIQSPSLVAYRAQRKAGMDTVPGAVGVPIKQHKSVPRWFRMAFRVAVLVGLVSLPALALKEASFGGLHKYKAYSVLFVIMGSLALPLWEPHLGNIVLAFTLLTPSKYDDAPSHQCSIGR